MHAGASVASVSNFNPRLPHGRRLEKFREYLVDDEFQSTPPSREATFLMGNIIADIDISIHASLTGGDAVSQSGTMTSRDFNPRLPHGRRRLVSMSLFRRSEFQSTPPSREATGKAKSRQGQENNFNPRLPHGRRLCLSSISCTIL